MLEIFNFEQGTPDWYASRLGIFTTSNGDKVLPSEKPTVTEKKTRLKYLHQLAGEVVTGKPTDSYTNSAMARGHEMEPDARAAYEFLHDQKVETVGFVRNGPNGSSPDGLIGANGAIEIKSKQPNVLIPVLKSDEFPAEHKAQCQGVLWICEREWIDLICYWPEMPLFVKRAYRDEAYIKKLSEAVAQFNDERDELVQWLRNYGVAA